MTGKEAEKIINAFGAALGKGVDGIARSESLLPCSKIKIRQAFIVYIDELIKIKHFKEKDYNDLVTAYSYISHFVDDQEAQLINDIFKKTTQGEIPEKLKVFMTENMSILPLSDMAEMNQYVKECNKKYEYTTNQ